MSDTIHYDAGSILEPAYLLGNTTTEGSEVDTDWVEIPVSTGSYVDIPYALAAMADDETLTADVNMQDATSIAGAGAADFQETAAKGADLAAGKFALSAVVRTAPDAGGPHVLKGVIRVRLPGHRALRGFVRAQITLTTSASGTVAYFATLNFCGLDKNPPDALPSFETV